MRYRITRRSTRTRIYVDMSLRAALEREHRGSPSQLEAEYRIMSVPLYSFATDSELFAALQASRETNERIAEARLAKRIERRNSGLGEWRNWQGRWQVLAVNLRPNDVVEVRRRDGSTSPHLPPDTVTGPACQS